MTRKTIILIAISCMIAACQKPFSDESNVALEFQAVQTEGFTRVAGKDTWIGDGSEVISITLTQNGTSSTGQYKVSDVTGSTNAITPAYWHNSSTTAAIKAIFPAELVQKTVNISNQSTNTEFRKYDFLTASENVVNFGTKPNLQFSHAMAKIHIILTAGTGIDLNEVTEVRINNNTDVRWSGDKLIGSTPGQIKTCKESVTTYEALVVPGVREPGVFVEIDIKGGKSATTVGGKTFVYTPATGSATSHKAGHKYVYNITVGMQ